MRPLRAPAGTTTTWRFRTKGAVASAWPVAALRCTLPFASCYVYAPRGEGLLSAEARLLCRRVKMSDPQWLPRYAGQVADLCARDRLFAQLFARDVWLVPVPGCRPVGTQSTVAWQLAMALHGLGLARGLWPGLARQFAVGKSATALRGERPTVRQHYESLSVCEGPRELPQRLILVDDVITRGRTLLAAATRLRGKFAHADVRAFAFVRTMGFLTRIDRLLTPCIGVVYWARGDAQREP